MTDVGDAMEFMLMKHKGQRRKGGLRIPYATHPVEVMKVLSAALEFPNEDRLVLSDNEMLIAALWHDLFEDTNCTAEEVIERANVKVSLVVSECTRPEEYGNDFYSKYEWLVGFKEKSLASVVVKIVDRFCNVADYMREPKKQAYAAKYAMQAYPLYRIYLLNGKNNAVIALIRSLAEVVRTRYHLDMLNPDIEHEVGILCRHAPQQDQISVVHHSV